MLGLDSEGCSLMPSLLGWGGFLYLLTQFPSVSSRCDVQGTQSSFVLLAKFVMCAECLGKEFGTKSPLCCPGQTAAG